MGRLFLFLVVQLALPVHAAAGQGPKLDIKTLLIDYPTSALREGREGTVHYQLVVATNGKAKSCQITQSSGYPDLDEETCKTMKKRVRFSPATDADGKPIEGVYNSKFSFRIPR